MPSIHFRWRSSAARCKPCLAFFAVSVHVVCTYKLCLCATCWRCVCLAGGKIGRQSQEIGFGRGSFDRPFQGSRWRLRRTRSAMEFECHFGTVSTQIKHWTEALRGQSAPHSPERRFMAKFRISDHRHASRRIARSILAASSQSHPQGTVPNQRVLTRTARDSRTGVSLRA